MIINNTDTQKKLSPPIIDVVETSKTEDTETPGPTQTVSQTPVFTSQDADVNDMARMELNNQDFDDSDQEKKNEKPQEARDQIIQSVYLGDRPIIGGVKIAKKNNNILSRFSFSKTEIPKLKQKNEKEFIKTIPQDKTEKFKTEEYKTPKTNRIRLPLLKSKMTFPIILGLILLTLSAGAYFAIKTSEPQQDVQTEPDPIVTEPQTIKIVGEFTFPSDIKEDPFIKKMTEAESQPIKLSLININSIDIDLIDSEILSIKFE